MMRLRKSKIIKQILLASSVLLILLSSSICAFAIPPNDPNVVDPYEPFYMNIEGEYFGNVDTLDNVEFSNHTVDFFSKSSTGLAGVQYNYSEYSHRGGNTAYPYYIYFDYVAHSNNIGTSANPRMYVWCANGAIESNGNIVGSNSSAVGFDLQFDHSAETLNVSIVSGGNIQYNRFTLYDVSNWLTYDYDMYGESEWLAKVYSFRIKVTKESGTIELQALTENWFTTIKSISMYEDAEHTPTYDRLAFGTFDKVTGFANGVMYGAVMFMHIRYSDYDYIYETAYSKGLSYGSEVAYREGKRDGEEEGYWRGYDEGKIDGELNASYSELAIPDIFNAVTDSTITIFRSIFGFEIFGVNVAALIGSLGIIAIAIWMIKTFTGK